MRRKTGAQKTGNTMNKAFFLDRDGVIVEEEHYLSDPAKVRLCPGCIEAFRKIADAGYRIIVTSNQSGIARGYFTFADVAAVERRICDLLAAGGAPLPLAWYYCPHHTKGTVMEYVRDCNCRKPHPGMLLQAAEGHDISLADSVMIGDKLSDLRAAFAAGCPAAALVRTGHGSEQTLEKLDRDYAVADHILDAVNQLLALRKGVPQ